MPGEAASKSPRTIVVAGTGVASAVPDVVNIGIAVRTDADDVASALAAAGATVSKVTAAVRELGLASRDIGSTGAGVQPRYDREGLTVIGYTAYHQLRLVVRAVDLVGAVVEACAKQAGNTLSVDSISLDIADRAPLERDALDAAFAHAHAKATQLAALATSALGEVRSIQEGAVSGGPTPFLAYRSAKAMGAADSMPVEAGENSVSAQVTVEWALVEV